MCVWLDYSVDGLFLLLLLLLLLFLLLVCILPWRCRRSADSTICMAWLSSESKPGLSLSCLSPARFTSDCIPPPPPPPPPLSTVTPCRLNRYCWSLVHSFLLFSLIILFILSYLSLLPLSSFPLSLSSLVLFLVLSWIMGRVGNLVHPWQVQHRSI